MAEPKDRGLSYADAGVDIDAGDRFVDRLKPLAASTRRPGADAVLGGFGGLFDLKAAGFDDPILVAGADGVGTKLEVALATGRHHGIGVDLVAMCANDVLAQGAEPLFFLDYIATSSLKGDALNDAVAGVAEGCRLAGCALIGGETAEMPDMYSGGRYDMAGFCVGAAPRDGLLPNHHAMAAGDVLIALASSGPHANGFSLIRKIVARAGVRWDATVAALSKTLADAVLEPTRIYVPSVLPLIRDRLVKGAAHITGGGLIDNPRRMIPPGLSIHIDYESWGRPEVFDWLQETGGVADEEMRRTFNCGVGLMLAVAHDDAERVIDRLTGAGETAWACGEIREVAA